MLLHWRSLVNELQGTILPIRIFAEVVTDMNLGSNGAVMKLLPPSGVPLADRFSMGEPILLFELCYTQPRGERV